jgi:hypothetical protein
MVGMTQDTVVGSLRILAIALLFYAVIQFWHEYYYWSGVFHLSSGISTGSTYFHWEKLWSEITRFLSKNLGWVRASLLALVVYIFIRGQSHWRGLAIGVPASIVLAGLAIALGMYLGLKAVGSEIAAFGPVHATVTLETITPIDVDLTQ